MLDIHGATDTKDELQPFSVGAKELGDNAESRQNQINIASEASRALKTLA